jgi:peroxiredoxin
MLADKRKVKLVPRMQLQFAPLRMVGKPLKAFSVSRHAGEGRIDSEALKGKVVLVDFWAAWCRPCMAELPYLRDAHKRFSGKGFEIVSISLDEDQKRFETVVEGEKMNWLHHFDGRKWKNEVAVLFDVHSIPMNLLVDRKGIVRAANLRGAAVARRVQELLREGTVTGKP